MTARLDYWLDLAPLASAPHLLIAGATGSGKSTAEHSLLYTISALRNPRDTCFLLLDPKRVELAQWRKTRFCAAYADEPEKIIDLLRQVNRKMDSCYSYLQLHGLTHAPAGDTYVIVDELADLMVDRAVKDDCFRLLQRIAALGRAARFHLIACTQAPSRAIIPAALTLNFTHKLALRCDSQIESRQVINAPGAELLPRYGRGILRSPDGLREMAIPMTPSADLAARREFWKR